MELWDFKISRLNLYIGLHAIGPKIFYNKQILKMCLPRGHQVVTNWSPSGHQMVTLWSRCRRKTDILQLAWPKGLTPPSPAYGKFFVIFLSVWKKQVFLVQNAAPFSVFLLGQNFCICLWSGPRGLITPSLTLKYRFFMDSLMSFSSEGRRCVN